MKSQNDLQFQDDIEEMYFEAANWLRMAISMDENLREAHYMLGLFHEQGLSVDKNHELAFKYYQKASSLGHVHSLTRLGHFFYSGVKRTEFLQTGSMHDNTGEVLSILAQFESSAPPSGQKFAFVYAQTPNLEEAIRHYQLAVSKGHDPEAYNALGLLYEQGIGTVRLGENEDVGNRTHGDSSYLIRAAKMYE